MIMYKKSYDEYIKLNWKTRLETPLCLIIFYRHLKF